MKQIKKILSIILIICMIIGYVPMSSIVSEASSTNTIMLGVGEIYTIDGSVSDRTGLDTSIAKVEATTATEEEITLVSSLTVGCKYYITNARSESVNKNSVCLTSDTNGTGLLLSGNLDAIPDNAVWELTGITGEYGLKQGDSYLNIPSDGSANMTGSEDIALIYGVNTTWPGTWQINDTSTSLGLNHYGGGSSTKAAGHGISDGGNAWNFYEITEAGAASTTITGLSEGITTVSINDVVYKIIVGDNVKTVDVYIGETVVLNDTTGDYSSSWGSSNLDTNIAMVALEGNVIPGGTETSYTFTQLTPNSDSSVTGVIKSGDTYMTLVDGTLGTTTDVTKATEFTVTYNSDNWNSGYVISASNYYLRLSNGTLRSTSNRNNATLWDYNSTSGFYKRQGNNYYLNVNGVSNSPANPVGLYEVNTQTTITPDTAVTEISIKGISAGQTYATIGNTLYIINVSQKEANITLFESEQKVFNGVSGELDTSSVDTNVLEVSLTNGTLTVLSKVDVADDATVTTSFIVKDETYGNVSFNVTILPETETKPVIAVSSSSDNGVVEVSAVTINKGMEISLALNGNIELPEVYYCRWYLEGTGYISTSTTEGDEIMLSGLEEGVEYLTLVITDEDGAVIYIHEIEVTVLDNGHYGSTGRIVDIYIDEVKNTSAYVVMFYDNLNESGSDDYSYEIKHISSIKLLEDELIYIAFDTGHNLGVDFFGGPDDGYVLTRMSSTNSQGDYISLYDTDLSGGEADLPENSDFIQTAAGKYQVEDFNKASEDNGKSATAGLDYLAGVVETLRNTEADPDTGITYNCQAGMGFTRGSDSNSGVTSSLAFYSEKMPTVKKSVAGILGTSGLATDYREYEEGMTAREGETVYFKIDVISYEIDLSDYNNTAPITYSNVYLTESLVGSSFYNITDYETTSDGTYYMDLTDEISGSTGSTDTYYVTYVITEDDLDRGYIENTVDLSYSYQATFSKGSYNVDATSSANITLTDFEAENIIVDFALPVTVSVGDWEKGNPEISGGKANYGDVLVDKTDSGYNVTYTPTKTLQGADTISLVGTVDDENGNRVEKMFSFMAYPATTVYYEEYFATTPKDTTLKQRAEYVGGANNNVYGYDDAYNTIGASGGTTLKHTEASSATFATFNFTGTGVDVYTNNDTDTGILLIWLKNSAGKTVRIIQADTHMANGNSYFTSGQAITTYNVPIASITGLDLDNYTVELRHVPNNVYEDNKITGKEYKEIRIDGFRVHGTIDVDSTIYKDDGEANPIFVELRDAVLSALSVKTDEANTIYADDIATSAWNQVYASGNNASNAVLITSYNTSAEDADGNVQTVDVQDLLNNGPKNELYLRSGDAVVFKVSSDYDVQLGLKALNATVTYSISGKTDDVTLSTSTDMFYEVAGNISGDYKIITVTNKSGGILSITEIKLLKTVSTSFAEPVFYSLNEADLVPAMLSLGFKSKEPEIIAGDLDGDSIVTATDALIVLRYVADLEELSEEQLLTADMDGNGKVSARDALMILQTAAHII